MTAIPRDDGDFLDSPATIDGIFPKQFLTSGLEGPNVAIRGFAGYHRLFVDRLHLLHQPSRHPFEDGSVGIGTAIPVCLDRDPLYLGPEDASNCRRGRQ